MIFAIAKGDKISHEFYNELFTRKFTLIIIICKYPNFVIQFYTEVICKMKLYTYI